MLECRQQTCISGHCLNDWKLLEAKFSLENMIVFDEDPVIIKTWCSKQIYCEYSDLGADFLFFVEYQNNAIISHYALRTMHHLNMSHITLLQKWWF